MIGVARVPKTKELFAGIRGYKQATPKGVSALDTYGRELPALPRQLERRVYAADALLADSVRLPGKAFCRLKAAFRATPRVVSRSNSSGFAYFTNFSAICFSMSWERSMSEAPPVVRAWTITEVTFGSISSTRTQTVR